jgi:hypothetical protein
MIKFDVQKPRDYFCHKVLWTLGIHSQISTLAAFDLDRIHHFSHALLQQNDIYCIPEWNQ